MCPYDQSLVTLAFLWEKLSQPQFCKDLTRKNTFLGVVLVQAQYLGLALGTNLKFYTTVAKVLKLKVRKFWGLRSLVEVTWEKLVGQSFCYTYKHHHTETLFIFSLCETMSRRRSIYDVSVWSVFLFYLDYN